MADYYTSTAFTITTTRAEAELIEDAIRLLSQAVDGTPTDDEAPSDAFLEAFPPINHDDPLSGLRAIFPDPDWPTLGIEVAVSGIDDSFQVALSGSQADFDAIAELLFRAAKPPIPFGFSYGHHCAKLRDDAFGGGYRIVTDDGAEGADLGDLLDRAFSRTVDGEGATASCLRRETIPTA